MGGRWRRLAGGTAAGALALALGALLPACSPEADPPEPKGDVVIGGDSYRFPDQVFADGLVDHGPQDSLLLELPLTTSPPPGEEQPTIRLLLIAPRTSDARERERLVASYVKQGAFVDAYFHSPSSHRDLKAATVRAPDAPSQLTQVQTDFPSGWGVTDLFVGPSLSHVTDVVNCTRIGPSINFPDCSQEFSAPGMHVKATYDRGYVKDWSKIKSYVLAILNAYRVR